MTSPLLFLQNSVKVKPADGDLVEVTVMLPSDLFLHYVRLLDSLTGFVRILNAKTRHPRSTPQDLTEESKKNIERYHSRIVDLFDRHTAAGLDRKETVKRISAELRLEKHPWASSELVRSSLVAAGRGGKSGRPRSQS